MATILGLILSFVVMGSITILEVFTLCNAGPFGPGCPVTRLLDFLTFGSLGLNA